MVSTMTVLKTPVVPLGGALIAAALGLVLVGSPVAAATPEGVWLTPPDQKGQYAHVVTHRCGKGLCGTIERTYDASGKRITTPNVGVRVFWDMVPDGDEYTGRAYVPAHRREYAARMKVQGRSMEVKGCLGPVCQSQIWRRVD